MRLSGSTVRPRVLVFAYACHPTRGSEDGIGWGLVEAVRAFADCTVLVAPWSMRGIERWLDDHEAPPGVTFVEVEEARASKYLMWHRIPFFVQYLWWMRGAYRVGLALHREHPFDAVHHATVSVYWLPTAAARLGLPLVWGPVGGAVVSPRGLWSMLGPKGILDEWLDMIAVRLASLLPATRATWRRVSAGLVNNEETLRRLPRKLQARCEIANHALFPGQPQTSAIQRNSHVLYCSSLESRKGTRLALEALARTPRGVSLVVAGDGPELGALRRMAGRLQVSDRVTFRTGLTRDEALREVAGAAAVLFTGLREEGGASLAETMALGSPAVVLANGGARTVAESCIDDRKVVLIEPASAPETAQRMAVAMASLAAAPPPEVGTNNLAGDAAEARLRQAFANALGIDPRDLAERPPEAARPARQSPGLSRVS